MSASPGDRVPLVTVRLIPFSPFASDENPDHVGIAVVSDPGKGCPPFSILQVGVDASQVYPYQRQASRVIGVIGLAAASTQKVLDNVVVTANKKAVFQLSPLTFKSYRQL
ncbi:hypothetical protein CIB48_g3670 [Xylaria polymorpha]|nr:hypothetical protein CIB48_g3670 [Xylaria polymorpha]